MTDTRDTLENEAINLAHNIYRRLTNIEAFAVTTAGELRSEILASATVHVRHLTRREDTPENAGSARVVCRALFNDNDPPSNWWRTPIGQDVAWAIGYPTATATVAATVDVLGCSRSYVLRLIRDGRLATNGAGDVVAVSLRNYARRTAAANRGGNTSARW